MIFILSIAINTTSLTFAKQGKRERGELKGKGCGWCTYDYDKATKAPKPIVPSNNVLREKRAREKTMADLHRLSSL